MRGTAYAITEIVVFLAIATMIGVAIGWMLSRSRAQGTVRTVPEPAPAEATDRTKQLEERIKRLESEKQEMAVVTPDVADLRKELAQAQWQIRALEDALAGDIPG
jgi:hypothetical protein